VSRLKETVGVRFVAVASVCLMWPLAVAFPINGGDALWVAQSSRALVQCARDGVWSSCPGTYQFGWLQHIPGIFLAWKGLDDIAIVTVLTLINAIAFAWMCIALVKELRHSPSLLSLAGLVIVAGPLYAFSVYSFSEVLVTALVVGMALSLFRKGPWWVSALLAFLVASSRETGFLVVAPVAAAVVVSVADDLRDAVRRLIYIAVASTAGLVAVLWFNVWKYGSIANDHFTDPIRQVPGTFLKVKNFLAVWTSPSGGVIPVWFFGGLIAVCIPVLVIRRNGLRSQRAWAALLLLAVLFGQTLLLSSWYAPFGWVTWGPRLILPAVASVSLVSIMLFAREVHDVIASLRRRLWVFVVVVIVGTLAALPNLGFILDRHQTLQWFTPPLLPSCPVTANVEIDRPFYFSCALDFAPWQLGKTLWDSGLHQVSRGWGLLYSALIAVLSMIVLRNQRSRFEATTTSPPAIDEKRESARSIG